MESLVKLYPELNEEAVDPSTAFLGSAALLGSGAFLGSGAHQPYDKRIMVLKHLKRTNFDMINKMGTLIDLTKKVVKKMRL